MNQLIADSVFIYLLIHLIIYENDKYSTKPVSFLNWAKGKLNSLSCLERNRLSVMPQLESETITFNMMIQGCDLFFKGRQKIRAHEKALLSHQALT